MITICSSRLQQKWKFKTVTDNAYLWNHAFMTATSVYTLGSTIRELIINNVFWQMQKFFQCIFRHFWSSVVCYYCIETFLHLPLLQPDFSEKMKPASCCSWVGSDIESSITQKKIRKIINSIFTLFSNWRVWRPNLIDCWHTSRFQTKLLIEIKVFFPVYKESIPEERKHSFLVGL